MDIKSAAKELGASGLFSEADEQQLIPLIDSKLKHVTPHNRESWVGFFDELGEETSKQASHTKLGHEILKFASDLKHAPNDKAERALHSLNVGQVS